MVFPKLSLLSNEDGQSRCIGTYILPNRRVSTWYIDVIEEIGTDDDGVLFYIDKYLDVMLTPQGGC